MKEFRMILCWKKILTFSLYNIWIYMTSTWWENREIRWALNKSSSKDLHSSLTREISLMKKPHSLVSSVEKVILKSVKKSSSKNHHSGHSSENSSRESQPLTFSRDITMKWRIEKWVFIWLAEKLISLFVPQLKQQMHQNQLWRDSGSETWGSPHFTFKAE